MEFQEKIHQMFETNETELREFHRTIINQLPAIREFLTEGSIYFIGAGKSGIIANLLSSYFRSVNIKAYSIHPNDALHGLNKL